MSNPIIIDATGPDWEPTLSTRFFAQRLGDPKGGEFAFGSTPVDALSNLLRREEQQCHSHQQQS
jgi:hypothetical protein